MPTFARPLDALGALPPRNSTGETRATWRWEDFVQRKEDVMACGYRNWEDHQLEPLEFLMKIFTIEDLWDDITSEARSVLLFTWRDELEALGAELIPRREINGYGHGRGRNTPLTNWLVEGLELIGNPRLEFDPDFLRCGYPYHVGSTVGDLKACMVRCLLRECERKLLDFFGRRPTAGTRVC